MLRILLYWIGFTFIITISIPASGHPNRIKLSEAKILALDAARSIDNNKSVMLDDDDSRPSKKSIGNFYLFSTFVHCHFDGCSGNYGLFFVNAWTGDVWDESCINIKTPFLSKKNKNIRNRLHVSRKEYNHLHSLKPNCG